MSCSVLNAKNDLVSILHGTTLNQVSNIDGLFLRTARQIIMDCDPQETKRIVTMASPIYNQVYNYALPNDVKGNRIIDLRPQANRSPNDNSSQVYAKSFDLSKATNLSQMFEVQFNTGIKTLRIARTQSPNATVLNEADSVSSNGVWVASSSASDLKVDNLNFASGSGSLSFDLAALGSTGILTNSTINPIDLSNYANQATLFAYVYLPTGTDFSSVQLIWGSSATDYYSRTVTVTQENTAFQSGWNLLSFQWNGATQVGTPVDTAIDYLKVAYNYNGTAQTAVHLDNIMCQMGELMEIVYYSKFLFKDAITGAFQEEVTDDSNLINLDSESYNLFIDLLAFFAGQQVQGVNALNFDYMYFLQEYNKNLLRYRMLYRSEVIPPMSVYYKKPSNNFGQYYSRRYNY